MIETRPVVRAARPAPRRRRRIGPGWVPREHGAWAMLVVPVVVGAAASGPTWRHGLLLVAWLVAYAAFHATSLWLKSSRKRKYLPPVRAYAVAVTVLGAVLLASAPALLRWAPVYVVLLAIGLRCAARRAERSWLNDGVTVASAMLMTVVAAGLGRHGDPSATAGLTSDLVPPGASDPAAWAVTAVLAAYFLGTVPYVKTLLRERGDRGVLALSIGYHATVVVAAFAALLLGDRPVGVVLVVVAVGLAARAVLVPRRRPWPSARAIGFGEIAATVAVSTAALCVALA